MDKNEMAEELKRWGAMWGSWVGPKGDEARYKRMAECAYAGAEAILAAAEAREADQRELAEIRESLRSRHAAPLTGQTVAAAVRCALDNGDSHYAALRSRAEAAESLLAGMRGALEAANELRILSKRPLYADESVADHMDAIRKRERQIADALALTPASAWNRIKAEALKSLQPMVERCGDEGNEVVYWEDIQNEWVRLEQEAANG